MNNRMISNEINLGRPRKWEFSIEYIDRKDIKKEKQNRDDGVYSYEDAINKLSEEGKFKDCDVLEVSIRLL